MYVFVRLNDRGQGAFSFDALSDPRGKTTLFSPGTGIRANLDYLLGSHRALEA